MQYFRNTDLAKLYLVSDKAVANWIISAQKGKSDLQLHVHNDKSYIANTTKNLQLIEELVERNKKFKNTRGYKVIKPSRAFYESYNRRNITDIIANLDIHREIPLQYSYFDGSADSWDEFINRLQQEETPNILSATISLLGSDRANIKRLIEGYSRVNVIDLGVGNAVPVRELLEYLHYDEKILGRYIGIDISPSMLDLAERNIKKWFNGDITFEKHVRDISYERFSDLLTEGGVRSEPTVNIVLMLGGTLGNFRSSEEVLSTVCNSLGKHDLFIHSEKLDTEVARRYFDFSADSTPTIAGYHGLALKLLNIDESLYDTEQYFDQQRVAREIRIRLKVAVSIVFDEHGFDTRLDLNKGETILLWRYWHRDTLDLLALQNRAGLEPLQISTTKDRQFIISISTVRAGLPK